MPTPATIKFVEGDTTPTTPPASTWLIYFKADGLYILDDAGTETQVTAATDIDVDSVTTDQLFLDDGSELTIASGSVTVTHARHVIDTEADAASDDLDTLSGMAAGEILLFGAANAARTVVVKDGVDNIATTTGADITLDETAKLCLALSDGTTVIVAPLFDAIGGTVGTTDNAVPRADGTGGGTLQASGVTIDDSNNVDGVAELNASGESRFSGDLISQSDNFVVRSATAGSSNPNFYFLEGDYDTAGVNGFGFFNDVFSTGNYQLFKASDGLYDYALVQVTPSGIWSLNRSVSTPGAAAYPQMVNNSGEFVVVDTAGNATTISPHPADSLVDRTGRPTSYVHKEENSFTGQRVELDVYGALADLEASTGNQYIYAEAIDIEARQNPWVQDDIQFENQLRQEINR